MTWRRLGTRKGIKAVWITGSLAAPIVAHFVVNYLNLGHIVATEIPKAAPVSNNK